MSKVIRSVKNVTKGYSSTQVKVRNATSNDPWGPTGTEMSEIARMTFDTQADFFEIMDMLDKRLNDKGKNWRHVLKALKVLDYALHEGSEHVVVWAKDNMYIIKTLREFQFIDEEGRDQGLNIRVAARELTSLLQDEERLRNERRDRKLWKSRVTGIEDYPSNGGPAHEQRRRPRRHSVPGRTSSAREEEDLEYRLAIEASKNQAEEDRKRMSQRTTDIPDDDLAKAIKLSKEEEERRQRELEQSNADSLFDDAAQPQQPQQFPQQGFGNDYQQLGQVDFFGNPVGQQNTGFLNSVYTQQPTGQQGYPTQQFPQPTGFEQQQQQPQYQMPQITGYNPNPANPYAQPQNLNPQPTNFLQPGDNNPYANGLQVQQPLQPLPTGSNNPFAPKMNTFNSTPARNGPPNLNTLAEQQQQNQFTSSFPSYQSQQQPQQQQQTGFNNPSFSMRPVSPGAQPQQKPANPQHAHLEALLQGGNENGLDTFGNVGNLRIPAQHTAPGQFVNSAGTGRVPGQQTGNPYFQNQQFTGMPQATGFGTGGLGANLVQQQRPLVPALTGPAGMNGYGAGQPGTANPFGRPPQQQQGGGNLIDF